MDDLLRDFLTESLENLARLDQEIVELERSPGDAEILQSIFRTIHTIKGTCGFLELSRLESVAHAAENVLGLLRDGKLDVRPEVISDVLAAVDVIRAILDGLEADQVEPAGDDASLIARLDRWMEGETVEEVSLDEIPFPLPVVMPPATLPAAAAGEETSAPPEAAEAERDRSERSSITESTLRVHVEILDLLMNLAGELVLTRNQLMQLSQDDEDSEYRLPVQHLNRVTSDLQEAVMKTRMQPIGNAWSKLPRMVRDLAQASGKQIDLRMIGAETELDRQILQAIQDPLTHMIRNSADHGIEAPEVRAAAGKPKQGVVRLEAFHEGGHIIIEIADDGKGLDAAAIRRKALERGLVREESAASLSDSQIFKFIFEAGFSTAEKITNVSGRGVGMDVVRSNIEKIGGSIELSSVLGEGTTFRIKIPLTLAILSALIVGTAGQSFAIPQIAVDELVRIGDENRSRVEDVNGTRFYRLRETLLPLVHLSDVLHLPATEREGESIVVCQVGAHRFGLVVDEIFDTHEIVVKPIGRLVKAVPFYSGTTILGDGRVIMILDVPSIAALENATGRDASRAPEPPAPEESLVDDGTGNMSLVLFSSGGEARQAVPLALVSRLEKIPTAEIEHADGRWLVQYRGALLPLVPASDTLEMRAVDPRPVIVFHDGEHSMGLAVDEIHDIVEDRARVEMEPNSEGLLGTAVIAGRSTEVVDIHHFLRRVDPRWFRPEAGVEETRGRILLVDDSPFFLNVIAPVLRASRYQILTAKDGQDALNRLEEGERFDLVVSDIDMPQVDGFEFVRRVRKNPEWRDLPMLALTGRETPEDRARALELGYHDFLTKFDRRQVLAAVDRALRGTPQEALA